MRLRTLLGNHAHLQPLKDGRIRSPRVTLDFADEPQPHEAFKPFVRDLAFDCGELAIVTYLQAKAFGKSLVLLPVVVSSRFHHGSICYNSAHGELSPKDIEGRSAAVRTYSQTTGVWVRGILDQDYGVDSDQVTWVTCDESHLAEYSDPANVVRAAPGQQPDGLLGDGEVAAAIPISLASRALYTPPYRTLVPDPQAAAMQWYERHHIVPVNHLFVVRKSIVESDPESVVELVRMLRESKEAAGARSDLGIDMVPFGIEENRRNLELVIQFAYQQHLIDRPFEVDELFDDIRGIAGAAGMTS
ncbi:phosphate ABC transporter substrate-binding protein [Phyllobacterium lublinensis]|uniref:phosphate ABC transporter substrate-binding protein n=1 Tax=Phyllobacterium lublinensis TaxID=2875708 RepID=UPI001CCB2C46|nr:phosphate ABC transporter substrate-binding protein [Phyllobacterium sp. 2063]MBZ9653736.1 phosphate ABC transporter substrate-binding protein [Phyllobacterium sp. 2063]